MVRDRAERFFTTGWGLHVGGFVWGLAEAIWFFVVPDVLLTLAATYSWRRAVVATVWAVLGAVLGGAIMYDFSNNDLPLALAWLNSVPLVSSGVVAAAADSLREHGLPGVSIGSWHGIPYKTYAVMSGSAGIGFWAFILASIASRLQRMIATALLAAGVAALVRRYIPSFARLLCVVWAAVWIIVYMDYTIRMLVYYH